MAAENKFLFETDFSDLEALESRAEKYSEADIAAARQAAMEEVRNELREFEEKRAADLMAQMAARLEQLSAGRQQDLQAATESAIDIAVAMCRKILPALAAKNALSEIEGHVARTLAEVQLRGRTGASLIAVSRGEATAIHPSPEDVLVVGDVVCLVGNASQIAAARELLERGPRS